MLIGFMGPKGSGKDTCGDFLVKNYGFIKKSFADPLKKVCQELFLFSNEQVNGTIEQKETPDNRWFGCTPRTAMQYVGTELFRDHLNNIMPGLEKNIFIHHFELWYQDEIKKNPQLNVVVTDVRFDNEAKFIRDLGGIVVKLERKTDPIKEDLHSSEIEINKIRSYNYLIKNNGSINSLYRNINEIILT